VGVSLATHVLFLLAFGMITYAAHTDHAVEFRTEVVDTSLPEKLSSVDSTELAQIDKPQTIEPTAGSFAPTVAPVVIAPVPENSQQDIPVRTQDLARAEVVLPMATRLDQAVTIRGTGSEHVGSVEGAIDRVAVEILRRLERGRTLVIWAFDASGSLVAEREHLSKHIQRVYTDLFELADKALVRDNALLSAVVAFGQDRKVLTPEPTADLSAIANAIGEVPLDASGDENTFQTVAEIVRRYGHFKRGGDFYHTMVVVVTDEAGDDENYLEEAISQATSAKVPVYVLGSPALFGRVEGYMDYTEPVTKRVYRDRPVHQGPESAMVEQIRLPYWYAGPQFDRLDAGFGPYGLSRLAGATGGIYFVTRMGPNRVSFDPTGMREYKPDWVSRHQYELAVSQHPLRQAVLQAALITQQNNLPNAPGLTFPPADDPSFKQEMAKHQEVVARIAYTVDMSLEPILSVSKLRDHETSRRWRAHYDLTRGRLTAMKIRCYEYNWACAKMKKDPLKFSKPEFNAWRLVPDKEVHYSEKAAAAGKEAQALLKRVIEEHPGTPWAVLAERELKDAFGLKWAETTAPPRPKPNEAAAKKAMPKNNPAPKPEALPKL
jgi:Mg-chelatase subunit ChlD